jgi:hypothetical protein
MNRASRNRLTLNSQIASAVLKSSDPGGRQGWLDGPLAVDVMRVGRVRRAGYFVHTQTIPGDITPQNRLLLAEPGGK